MANLHASVSLAKIPRPPPFFMTSASGQVISQPTTLEKNMAALKIKLFLKHHLYYLQVALLVTISKHFENLLFLKLIFQL